MKKGQRPVRHERIVQTKRGFKKIVVNPNIVRMQPRQHSSKPKVNTYFDAWNKKEVRETMEDYMNDENSESPEFLVRICKHEGVWQADIVIGWDYGPEMLSASISSTDAREFDNVLKDYVRRGFELVDEDIPVEVRIDTEKHFSDTNKAFDDFLKEYGGNILAKGKDTHLEEWDDQTIFLYLWREDLNLTPHRERLPLPNIIPSAVKLPERTKLPMLPGRSMSQTIRPRITANRQEPERPKLPDRRKYLRQEPRKMIEAKP